MNIKKGDLLNIEHKRKGFFKAIATRDFDTAKEDWYPVVLAPDEYARGIPKGITTQEWMDGDEIPCRKSLVRMILIETKLSVASNDEA